MKEMTILQRGLPYNLYNILKTIWSTLIFQLLDKRSHIVLIGMYKLNVLLPLLLPFLHAHCYQIKSRRFNYLQIGSHILKMTIFLSKY